MAQSKRSTNPLTLVLVLSAVFFIIFLVISGMLFLSRTSGRSGAPVSASLFGGGAVAVIELNGVIMESKKILKTLERHAEDSQVKAVVLRMNSPGGSVAPSQEIYQAVKAYKKPVVVSMGSVAASGAYYIACGATRVFANPGTITGSIGVIMEFANLEKLYEWAKIQRYSIKTGKFKDAGAEYRGMLPEERALLQSMVNDVLEQFKRAVMEGRELTAAQVSAVADGRILSGHQAKKAKLVDELGGIEEAITAAAKLGKIKGKPNVIYPEREKRKLLDLLLDDRALDDGSEESQSRGWLASWIGRLVGHPAGLIQNPILGLSPGIYWLWTGTH